MSNPYIIPNFHSLTEIKASFNSNHHCFNPNIQLDYNGSGFHNNIALKNNKTANYYALRPNLPYFLDNLRVRYDYAAKNCLIYCQDQQLLLSTTRNKIIGLHVEENKVTDIKESDVYCIDVAQKHSYSYDESVSCGPFQYHTQNIYQVYNCEQDPKPILELKLNSYGNSTEIIANSRNKIRFLRFNDENEINLELFHELNDKNISCPQLESMFANSDRNPVIKSEILVSYTSGDIITNYDIETNETIWSSKGDGFRNESNKQIGLYWSQWHPNMFFYGEHDQILFVDTRGHRNVVQMYLKGGKNLYDWEQFYSIYPNKLNASQLYVATDYHIFLTDLRFPKDNLIQLKHMLPKTLVRSLKSIVLEDSYDSRTEILVSSNFHRNCLMSFRTGTDSIESISPTSVHLPLHLSTPKDIDKVFENYFLRGLQLIPLQNKLGFSIALLTNFGDIFMQHLYIGCDDNYDKCFAGGIGSSNLILDDKTIEYMTCINNFIDRMLLEREVENLEINKCLNCTVSRKCDFSKNLCQCMNSVVFDEDSDSEDSDKESIALSDTISEVYNKHIGRDVRKLQEKLKNLEELEKKTNDYTKKIYKLWGYVSEI